MTISAFSDELAQVRTKKKEFLEQIERIVPWGGMACHDSAVLLQRRARQQTLSDLETDAAAVSAAKPL